MIRVVFPWLKGTGPSDQSFLDGIIRIFFLSPEGTIRVKFTQIRNPGKRIGIGVLKRSDPDFKQLGSGARTLVYTVSYPHFINLINPDKIQDPESDMILIFDEFRVKDQICVDTGM